MAPLADEVADGELGHLAGADEQDVLVGERTEDLARQIDRDRGDGDGADEPIWVSLRTFLATEKADCSRRSSEAAEAAPTVAGDGVGLFDLAEDLGFADDHGVERGGDAEEMADASRSRNS